MAIDVILPTISRGMTDEEFIPAADEVMAKLPMVITQINSTSATVNDQADQVAADAASAASNAIICQAASNFKGNWSSLSGALNMPAAVYHLGQFWVLTANLADVTAKVPGTASEWVVAKTINPLPMFTLSGSITKGQPVSVLFDGRVALPAATAFSANTESIHQAGSYYPVTCFDPATGKIVKIGYSSAYCRAQVGTINAAAGSISWGAESANIGGSAMAGHAVVADTINNKIIAFYSNSAVYAAVGTIRGTSITFGSSAAVASGSNASMHQSQTNTSAIFDVTSGKTIFTYRDSSLNPFIALATVSGTSINFNTPLALSTNFGQFTSLCYVPTINKYLVIGGRYVALATISGSTITVSTPVALLPSTVSTSYIPQAVYIPDTARVAIVYVDTATYGNVVMADVVLTAVVLDPKTVNFYPSTMTYFSAVYNQEKKRLQIAASGVLVYACEFSGSVLSGYFDLSEGVVFKSANSDYFNMCYSTTDNVAVVSYGTNFSRILTPYSSTADSFIGFAQASGSTGDIIHVATTQYVDESQTGLVARKKYYISDTGTLTTNKTANYAGLALSSTRLLVKG